VYEGLRLLQGIEEARAGGTIIVLIFALGG